MSFSAQIGNYSDTTKKSLQNVRRGVTIKLFSAVILDTPVDTGRLRGNWQMTEEVPASGNLDTTDKSGGTTVQKSTAGIVATTGNNPVFLTNNLAYAERIEFEGWSHTKAPQGMVRKNVVRFNGLIRIQAEQNGFSTK